MCPMKGSDIMTTFHRICEPFRNIEHIHPLMQKSVLSILKHLKSCVKRVIIFGSSTSNRCQVWSDLDVYVECTEDVRPFENVELEAPLDLWTNYSVDDSLRNEIENTGVIVYER